LRGHGILPPDRLLGLAPGASSATKWWPARHFAQLADHTARTLGTRTLLIGSARDRDAVQAVRSAMTTPALDWTGTIDLSMLPAVIHRCAVLVSNDSGPMHVASAVRTPVIGLFGPTHPRLGFTPLGPQDAALTLDLACSPCSLHGNIPCRIGTHACLDTLPVSRVIREVAQRLARPEDRAQTMT
jgi:heptosyltransferase-2